MQKKTCSTRVSVYVLCPEIFEEALAEGSIEERTVGGKTLYYFPTEEAGGQGDQECRWQIHRPKADGCRCRKVPEGEQVELGLHCGGLHDASLLSHREEVKQILNSKDLQF